MVSVVHRICLMDSQDLAGPIFHPLVVTSSIFWHNRCCQGGGQARSVIGATTCTNSPHQTALIYTFQQISPSLLLSHLCTYRKGVLVHPNLHKLTLVAPPSMRDDLHSYLPPLLLQLFRILNVCLNRVFEEFILLFLVNSSNPCRVMDTLCWAARPQTLDNFVFTVVSKGTPSSLTSPTLITSVGHVICDLGCR
jgi:hypothetical protein